MKITKLTKEEVNLLTFIEQKAKDANASLEYFYVPRSHFPETTKDEALCSAEVKGLVENASTYLKDKMLIYGTKISTLGIEMLKNQPIKK